ncbi:hypothetical protein T07_10500 [Trichinella nelsoni]|uniref:Uncharacterized protein n=1 Tax=Trichinella nelsoni TaxID=6336 RepID=A0A0V0RFY4_9BILA|nr:hypothetical protein T07_10500 [Trichinella nelsoni]
MGFVFKFLIPNYFSSVGSPRNAYIDMTKEESQYRWYGERLERPLPYLENFMPLSLMRKATFIDNVSQKCSSEITDNLSLISTVDDGTRYRYRLNKPVVFTSKALKTCIKKLITEDWFMQQKYSHLDTH